MKQGLKDPVTAGPVASSTHTGVRSFHSTRVVPSHTTGRDASNLMPGYADRLREWVVEHESKPDDPSAAVLRKYWEDFENVKQALEEFTQGSGEMVSTPPPRYAPVSYAHATTTAVCHFGYAQPTANNLHAHNLTSLAKAISRDHGGFVVTAQRLGWTYNMENEAH